MASRKRKAITIYGRDYPTNDGTCIRDYVHVLDICAAHLLALKALQNGKKELLYNLGTGHGFSVQQVIEVARSVTEQVIPVLDGPRRLGDPAILVADAALAKKELDWQPQYSDLDTLIRHAWHYQKKINQILGGNDHAVKSDRSY